MVRLFTALCKGFLEILSDEIIFDDATREYSYRNQACPCCGAIGKFSSYGKYSRGLFYHKGGKNVDSRVWVLRFKCNSCVKKKTHALLPDIFTPYSPYSLSFVITVLIAYFERESTVVDICAKFGIAVSTLYRWKKRIASHKELMIGILKSRATPALEFLRSLFESERMSDRLRGFFRQYGFSFLQNRPASATRSRSP
jgi:transposase-like protein